MKLLLVKHKKEFYTDKVDGYIVPLAGFSVSFPVKYNLEEVEELVHTGKEVFVVINKNITNDEILDLENVLHKLVNINVAGVLFYDLSVLSIVRRCDLKLPLIWSQTHMVTNYNTVQYYYEKGVEGALLSNEITLDEMLEIKKRVDSKIFANIVFQPVVSFSKRHLIDNYYRSLGREKCENRILIHEKVSRQDYLVTEEDEGTTFISSKIVNGTKPLLSMIDSGFDYGIIDIREGFSDKELFELIDSVKFVIAGDRSNERLRKIGSLLGNNTGFFYRKTIYKVK